MAEEVMTVGEAQRRLGVSKKKIAQIIKDGVLEVVGTDPLDKRIKLVKRSEVEALAARSTKKDAAA